MMRKYSFVDLFCGAGGFTEGMLLSGDSERRFRLIAASDVHQNAQLTHQNRFKGAFGLAYSFLREDIRSQTFLRDLVELVEISENNEPIDVVVGGPPCQGFSVFGARRESDPRNDLFVHYLRAISALRPKYFVMENVPGLATMYGGKTVDRIQDQVRSLGEYEITGPLTLNAASYGVPQFRERIVFIGNRRDMSPIVAIPNGRSRPVSVEDAIGDLSFLRPWEVATDYHESFPGISTYQRESRSGRLSKVLGSRPTFNSLRNHEAAKHTPDVIARFAMMKPGAGLDSIPEELWSKHLKSSKKWCVRLSPDKPSFTVVTLPDDFVHYQHPRILTVREMARLQSFDDSFEFLGPRASGGGGKGNKKRNFELPQYSQVGNAVPPLMARAIAATILNALDSQRSKTTENVIPPRLHRSISERRVWATS
jgi:DNA (cytosine-5)-methyltransferase 1